MADKEKSADESSEQNQPTAPTIPEGETQTPCAAKNSRDQDIQNTKNNFDRDLVRSTSIVAVFTALLFGAAVLQFCAMRGQQNIMQGQLDAMERDQRPWVGAPIEIKNVVSTDNKVIFTAIFENTGHVPTRSFYIDGAIISNKYYPWYGEVIKTCKEMKTKGLNNFSAIPHGKWPVRFNEMPSSLGKFYTVSSIKELTDPYIIGCVIYGSPIDKIVHQTGFSSRLVIDGKYIRADAIYAVDAD